MIMNKGITILGLGPGDPKLLSLEAWDVIKGATEIFLRTRRHPTVSGFPEGLQVFDFDYLYEEYDSFEDVYARIVDEILKLGMRKEGVIYAVPGHPFVAEATGLEIYRRAIAAHIPVQVCDGISFLEPVFTTLGIDPFDGISLVDAIELTHLHHPPFPPHYPVLIAQLYDRYVASEVKLTLMNLYSDHQPVVLVHGAGTRECVVEHVKLYEIDHSDQIGLLTVLYLPALGRQTAYEDLQEITAHLRAPEGCPWDREQTLESMQPHLLEEAYEALNAIDSGDVNKIKEEIGDLLLVITMIMQIGMEDGSFSSAEVIESICKKLVHRHPHVFSDLHVDGADGVLKNWERIKAQERKGSGEGQRSLLDGVTITLPALIQAQEYQDRAGRVGFDWPKIEEVWNKYYEEVAELQNASNPEEREAELGDVLFGLVNLARWYKIDAESALRWANIRFKRRFTFIEKSVRDQGRELIDMSLEEMEALWNQAKGL